MNDLTIVLIALLPIIAFLYSSVGHGGASGYLALMSIIGVNQEIMKPTALLLNILVAGTAFIFFYRGGFLRFKIFLAFAAGSIPASFVGGMIDTNPTFYKITLGIFLFIATLKLTGIFDKLYSNEKSSRNKFSFQKALLIGIVIGFFSGLIGIGGGIILSPIILILGWADVKESAAISALFILVNSISGFTGQIISGATISSDISLYASLAFLGGLAGAYFGTYKFNNILLKRVLASVLLFASIKLIMI